MHCSAQELILLNVSARNSQSCLSRCPIRIPTQSTTIRCSVSRPAIDIRLQYHRDQHCAHLKDAVTPGRGVKGDWHQTQCEDQDHCCGLWQGRCWHMEHCEGRGAINCSLRGNRPSLLDLSSRSEGVISKASFLHAYHLKATHRVSNPHDDKE